MNIKSYFFTLDTSINVIITNNEALTVRFIGSLAIDSRNQDNIVMGIIHSTFNKEEGVELIYMENISDFKEMFPIEYNKEFYFQYKHFFKNK